MEIRPKTILPFPSLEFIDLKSFLFLSIRLLLVVACLGGTALLAQNAEEGRIIAAVRFEGLKTLKSENLLRLVESKSGTRYDRARETGDLKRLGALAAEISVRHDETPEGLVLIFVLRENPVVSEVRLIGNFQIKTKDLMPRIGIKPGQVASREDVRKAREAVQKEYRVMGYARARIRTDLIPVSAEGSPGETERVILQVQIEEGPKIRVEDVLLEGNRHFSSIRLRILMETDGSWLFIRGYFDEEAFERDLRLIRARYVDAGFLDAQVARGEFIYDEEKRALSPRVVIVEGPRYRVASVKAQGATLFKAEEIEAFFQDMAGSNFSRKKFVRAMSQASALYADAGYLTTEIVDRLDFGPKEGEIHITLEVMEKERIRVGQIRLERPDLLYPEERSWFGKMYSRVAPPVKDEVILREIELRSGEIYRKRAEEISESRLQRLGVFQNVSVESVATDDPEVRDARVFVEPAPFTGNVVVGIGYAEQHGPYGWADFSERNLGGNADSVGVNFLVGGRSSRFGISHFNRHLGDSEKSLYSEAYHGLTRQPGFDERKTGVSSELGVPLGDPRPTDENPYPASWKLFLRARGEYVRTDEDGYDPEENFDREYGVGALRLSVQYDARKLEKLDGRHYDAAGGYLAASGIEGGYADGPLAKWTGSFAWYRKLGRKLVFASELEAALMPVNAGEIGPSERLYMGGASDMRGFDFRRAGPHDRQDDDVPLGGSTKLLARNELRYPIFEVLTGVVFLDAGMLDRDVLQYGTTRVSTGLGLRLRVQPIEMGVDFALPLLSASEDRKRYFHLSVRSPLRP